MRILNAVDKGVNNKESPLSKTQNNGGTTHPTVLKGDLPFNHVELMCELPQPPELGASSK